MSHGARVIRTGVSSGGPAAPPAATASSSAGSDAELMDGAYFRSCAGMLKVAQMVRGEWGGGALWGPLGTVGVAATPAGCFLWRRVWRVSSGGAVAAARCRFGRRCYSSALGSREDGEVAAPLAR